MYNYNVKFYKSQNAWVSSSKLLKLTPIFKKMSICILPLIASACSTSAPILHPSDYKNFSVLPESQRVMHTPIVRFKQVSDINSHCTKLIGKPNVLLQYFGCATWIKHANVCEIYLPPNPSIEVKGHELRHCFDGAFH